MSTFPFDMGTCPRADKKSSSYDKKDVYQPSHNAVYNECMPGVDLHDQFTAYIRAFLRSRKALKAFMLGKVFSCVSNARIILNELNPEKRKSAFTQPVSNLLLLLSIHILKPGNFHRISGCQIILLYRRKRPAGDILQGGVPKKKRTSFETSKHRHRPEMQDHSIHVPMLIPSLDGGKKRRLACSEHAQNKKRKDTYYYCDGCSELAGYTIPLCIDNGDCWRAWHRR